MLQVAIVGNAPLEHDHSQVIDQSHFVVRFNEAGNYSHNSGTRVDALCVTNLCDPGRRFARLRPLKSLRFLPLTREIWFPRPSAYAPIQVWFKPPSRKAFSRADYGRHIISRNGLRDKKAIWFTPTLYAAACRDLHQPSDNFDGKAPSSGYLAIKYVLERFPPAQFQTILFGFTFKGSAAHDWPTEEIAVRSLQESNLVQRM